VAQVGALALRSAQAYAELRVSANVDGLTRVFNKRHLGELLCESLHRIDRDGGALTLFLFDIDNFKHYNDANGHVAGDGLLRDLARLVEENTRKETVFGRFGGEEFLMLFQGCAEEVFPAAEKVRALIASYPFPFCESQPLGAVTVSGGVAEYPRDARDSAALIKAADKALYRSKQAGRNQVQEFSPNGNG
jgi:diguanylate cyclase (GGDEF)-like protein